MTRQYSSISVETTLASGISSTATSMTVASGTGSTLLGGVSLAPGNVDQFTVALDPDTHQRRNCIYHSSIYRYFYNRKSTKLELVVSHTQAVQQYATF
jgi:hypothetical protein